jgi:hypothetical protein
MPANEDQLDTPFRRAMLYVIEQLGEVGVMKLEKILYLADLEHYQRYGRKITGARWVRQRLGPVAKSVLPSTRMMAGQEITVSKALVGDYTSDVYRPGPHPRFHPQMAASERAVLDQIIELTRSISATDAARLTYETTPMLARLEIERREGHELLDEPLSFDRSDAETARVSRRQPKASESVRRAFKQAELARVADLVEASVAHSTGR